MPQPRVFVAYSPCESAEHTARVLAFATRLRENGVDARMDVWDRIGISTYGIYRWAQLEMAQADKVLIVMSGSLFALEHANDVRAGEYCRIYMATLATELEMADMVNVKYIPVFEASNPLPTHVPIMLQNTFQYDMSKDFDALLRRIFGIMPANVPAPPPIGPAPTFVQIRAVPFKQ